MASRTSTFIEKTSNIGLTNIYARLYGKLENKKQNNTNNNSNNKKTRITAVVTGREEVQQGFADIPSGVIFPQGLYLRDI